VRYLDKTGLLDNDVLAHNADICNAVSHITWDVVIAQEIEVNRKIIGRRIETLAAFSETNSDLIEQPQGAFAESPRTLKG
jgi:hypothetical protein